MPGIRLFNRTWQIGSDDFVWPVLLENLIRLIGFIIFAIFYIQFFTGMEKCGNLKLYIFYTGIIGILLFSMILNLLLAHRSSLGSIFDQEKNRRYVGSLVIFKFIFYLFEFTWIIMGTVWFLKLELLEACHNLSFIIVAITLILGWAYYFCILLIVFVFFDPLGSSKADITMANKVWKIRCRLCCCCIWSFEMNQVFEEVSKIFANYFLESGLIASDIAAGLVLLRREHKQRYVEKPDSEYLKPYKFWGGFDSNNYASIADSDSSRGWTKPQDWMNLKTMTHFFKYAIACYGWKFFFMKHKCLGIDILCNKRRTRIGGELSSRVHHDKPCYWNTTAILNEADINEKDLLYANFYNQLYAIPFYLAADHQHKCIVLSIRGTLSLYDAITDITVDYGKIEFAGSEFKVHKGILNAAAYINKEIRDKLLLQSAFELYPNYNLMIVGHSLGAGAAALLSILLKPTYPSLICFAYSPPGWLVSLELARQCRDFLCSLVVGKDLVSRMGMISLVKLRNDLLNILRNSKEPKYRILGGVICPFFRSSVVASVTENEPLVDNAVGIRVNQSEESILINQQDELDIYPLYIPGQILYLHEVTSESRKGQPVFVAYWSKQEYFDRILIGLRMFRDHYPSFVYDQIARMVSTPTNPTKILGANNNNRNNDHDDDDTGSGLIDNDADVIVVNNNNINGGLIDDDDEIMINI